MNIELLECKFMKDGDGGGEGRGVFSYLKATNVIAGTYFDKISEVPQIH